VELRPGGGHRALVRAGRLHLSTAAGDTVREPSAEASYAFHHRLAGVNARWRGMPASVQGVHLPGSDYMVDGTVKVVADWRLAARTNRSYLETRGTDFRSQREGSSLGLRWLGQGRRLELQANRREWAYGMEEPTVARTASFSLGWPVGTFFASAQLEHGEQQRDTLRGPGSSYQGSLRWNGREASFSWSTSYFETLSAPPRLRSDLLGSLKLGEWELMGGAWATRGLPRGGEPGVWSQLGIPFGHDLLLSVGLEHAPPTWGQPPQWLGTLGVRQRLAVPLPFLRDPGGR
jgi:hypothetical protein